MNCPVLNMLANRFICSRALTSDSDLIVIYGRTWAPYLSISGDLIRRSSANPNLLSRWANSSGLHSVFNLDSSYGRLLQYRHGNLRSLNEVCKHRWARVSDLPLYLPYFITGKMVGTFSFELYLLGAIGCFVNVRRLMRWRVRNWQAIGRLITRKRNQSKQLLRVMNS